MTEKQNTGASQHAAEGEVQRFKNDLGPFVVAADTTRLPVLFTNARSADNEIVYVNESLLELTGYTRAGALGLPFRSLLAKEADRRGMTPEAIAGKYRSTVELLCTRLDRTVFDASVLASPVCNDAGELEQYFISVFDLTEPVERRVRDHLREAEIYRHAPGFIAFTSGPDHRFTFANTAYETLVGRRNLVGKRVQDALPEIAAQGFIELVDKVFQSGERFVGKNTPIQLTRAGDGSSETRYVDFVYEPVRDASGCVTGMFCEGTDLTEMRLVTDRLYQSQAQLTHVSRTNAMGTMAATLAHEINQPLAAIANYVSGCINIVEKLGITSAKLHEGLAAIAAASDRAGKIISRLRRMTARVAPELELFDLRAALEEASHLVRVGGCERASINTRGASAVLALGDKIQVQQVIVNLLLNACEAAALNGKKGSVVATATQSNGEALIVVRDDGPGLPVQLEKDPFTWTESKKPDGMGVGLSICRTIIEGHGGRITLDETGPSGTSFSFSLPTSV